MCGQDAAATIADAPGLGMHESQSRGYENVIGRSRPFWEFWYPRLQEVFPEATKGVSLDDFVRQVNTSKRSFIRVEADELSYNLHLAVRFELERAMINGDLAVKDLPEAWNAGFEKWFGLRPPSDKDGVLQDVHWSVGLFGYFPTYTLGNVYAGCLHQALRAAIPDLDDDLSRGDLHRATGWLRAHLQQYGGLHEPRATIAHAAGMEPSEGPLLDYLEDKFRGIYGL